jgi:fused signal recognition particle receptor
MLDFLRRKKPDEPQRRMSAEEIAAAFAGADTQGAEAGPDVAPVDAATATPDSAIGAELVPTTSQDVPVPADEHLAPTRDAQADAVEATVNDPVATAPAIETLAGIDTRISSTSGASASAEPDLTGAVSTAPAAAAGKRGWLDRLRGNTFTRSITGLFARNPKLDDDLIDEIETALLTADVGVTATTQLANDLRRRMKSREFADANALLAALRADLLAMLEPVARPLVIDRDAKPFVLLTVGVNGVGKTTTIGKLAKRFKDEGRPLMLAAGDTFRAAAVAQIQAWGDRNGVPVIAQGQNADAASVAFDALQAAKARGTEVLIADTAGRLHTQQGLMAELGKIKRVLQKLDPAAPHEVLLVIDGTTGQNAISQLRQFNAAIGVTGLVVTKLDGTAKGGVVFALAREFGIPIRFAGIGERPEDLRVFDAAAFVDALLPESLGAG